MKKTFGLLGEKLGHSFSPLIHGILGEYEYPLYEISPNDLDTFMTERHFDGINVTIPHKQAVIPYCQSLSGKTRQIGSTNTIIKDENGLLHGYNTDYYGFCIMLKYAKIDPDKKKVLVLGDGGAARTVRVALHGLGAGNVITISRRGENNYGNIDMHYDADILINTTPVGMYPNNGNSPLRLEGFKHLTGVVDLIYNPLRTKLLLDAERLGIPCINGLTMLVAQAEMASRLFLAGSSPHDAHNRYSIEEIYPPGADCDSNHAASAPPDADCSSNCTAYAPHDALNPVFRGVSSPPDIICKITDTIQKATRNIALIGMPGCGKSTIGGSLSKAMGRPFADIDELIESAAGKRIPEIFEQDGEEAFRRLETQILANETKKSGIVIATGGGVVTSPENLDLLRQNSLVVYLKRNLYELVTDSRPVSQNVGIQALAEKRLHLYEIWSDYTVEVYSHKPSEYTVARIMEITA